jgi:hypothetical protein
MCDYRIKPKNDYSDLFYYIGENEIQNKKAMIDLRADEGISAIQVINLTMFCANYSAKNQSTFFLFPSDPFYKTYFKDIGLFNISHPGHVYPDDYKYDKSWNVMPIRPVNENNIKKYIEVLTDGLRDVLPFIKPASLEFIIMQLLENIQQHSFSKINPYIFFQYHRQTDSLVFCIADLGMGITSSLKNILYLTENDAMESDDENQYSDSDDTLTVTENSLYVLKEYAKRVNGKISIAADDLNYVYETGLEKIITYEKFHMQGTRIILVVNPDNLNQQLN